MIDRYKKAKAVNESANKPNSNNKTCTAIDWLIQNLENYNRSQIEWHEIIEKAKQIEKHQIITAMLDGADENINLSLEFAELYYFNKYQQLD